MEQTVPACGAGALDAVADPHVATHPLLDDPRFRALARQRRVLAWSLTFLMLAVYFSFILTLAFSPRLLGQPIVQGLPMTWGIPVGFGMFVFTFALVGVYVARANAVHDAIIADIRRGVQK